MHAGTPRPRFGWQLAPTCLASVVEAESWPAMIEEVRLVLPDLLELSNRRADKLSLTFKAEEHLELAG